VGGWSSGWAPHPHPAEAGTIRNRVLAEAEPADPRPANTTRMVFHVVSAASCLSLLAFLPVENLKWIAGSFALFAWTLELTRRQWPGWNDLLMRFYASIAHARERHVINSGTWYMTALVVLTLTHDRVLCTVAVAALGFGDPFAALIGRRFGRVRLLHGRTLEGSLAFVVAATLAAWGLLRWITPEVPMVTALWFGMAGGVAGAVAEMLSRRVDDNLSIPLTAAGAVWATVSVLPPV